MVRDANEDVDRTLREYCPEARLMSAAHALILGDVVIASKQPPTKIFSFSEEIKERWSRALNDSISEWKEEPGKAWYNPAISNLLEKLRPDKGQVDPLRLTFWFAFLRFPRPDGNTHYLGLYNFTEATNKKKWLQTMMPFLQPSYLQNLSDNDLATLVGGMQRALAVAEGAIKAPSPDPLGPGLTIRAFEHFQRTSGARFFTVADDKYRHESSGAEKFDAPLGMLSVAYFATEHPDLLIVASSPVMEHFWILRDFFECLAEHMATIRAQQFPSHVLENRVPLLVAALESLYFLPEPDEKGLDPIWGESDAINKLKSEIVVWAPQEGPIFILGEVGSGKELVARAIHDLSPRSRGPFVTVNCAAIAREFLEAEIFGYGPNSGVANAPPEGRAGKLEEANGGTLFLDEVANLLAEHQTKLLRALQSKPQEFERVGGMTVKVDVRIVSAAATTEGITEALGSRLGIGRPLKVPPLRERDDDVIFIVERLLRDTTIAAQKLGVSPVTLGWLRQCKLHDETKRLLKTYGWPKNVRELLIDVMPAAMVQERVDEQSFNKRLQEILKERIDNTARRAGGATPRATRAVDDIEAPRDGADGSRRESPGDLPGIVLSDQERESWARRESSKMGRILVYTAFRGIDDLSSMGDQTVEDKLIETANALNQMVSRAEDAKVTWVSQWKKAFTDGVAEELASKKYPAERAEPLAQTVYERVGLNRKSA